MPQMTAPYKLMIRQQGDWVIAWFATLDEKEKHEIGRMATGLFQSTPGSFDEWEDILFRAIDQFYRENGADVVVHHDIRPQTERN